MEAAVDTFDFSHPPAVLSTMEAGLAHLEGGELASLLPGLRVPRLLHTGYRPMRRGSKNPICVATHSFSPFARYIQNSQNGSSA